MQACWEGEQDARCLIYHHASKMPAFPATFNPNASRSKLPGQTRAIDDETVLHIALQHSLVSLVDCIGADHFDIRDDAVLGAKIEHLLCFRNPADHRTGKAAALCDQAEHLR